MKMRPLKTSDIFKMSKILKKLEVKLEANEDMTQEQIGVQFIQAILENLYKAEDEVNAFMADLVGMTAAEFSELPISDLMKVFELFKQQKGVGSFLELAGR